MFRLRWPDHAAVRDRPPDWANCPPRQATAGRRIDDRETGAGPAAEQDLVDTIDPARILFDGDFNSEIKRTRRCRMAGFRRRVIAACFASAATGATTLTTTLATMLGPAVAVELQQPVAPSSSGVVANPPVGNVANGCVPLGPAGTIVAAHLIVRNSSRPDVGPYTVTLPGYATNADPSTDRYAPFIIEAAGRRHASHRPNRPARCSRRRRI